MCEEEYGLIPRPTVQVLFRSGNETILDGIMVFLCQHRS